MILQENYQLANGLTIPKLGLGTWEIDDDKVNKVVEAAIEIGYRHIDTAQAYGNERGVGEGIKNSLIAREKLFVTTKVEAEIKNYDDAFTSIKQSLKRMKLNYLDLILIHSPQPWDDFRTDKNYDKENLEVWRALEQAQIDGLVRSIGVSNFKIADLDNLLTHAKIKPVVNQFLAHISNTPTDIITYCKEQDILVEAYSPIAHGQILQHPEIKKMAEKYDVSVPQLSIKYCLELGLLPLPKSGNPKHITENAMLDFNIEKKDLDELKRIGEITDYGDANVYKVFSQGTK
ncbi:aldo/keto reductase [Vagococcus sp.]|uniref:aldo/keto reductase n=1 Tax=Vagococcus sp. TaxID=1933889 RepID=UPI003F9EAF9F